MPNFVFPARKNRKRRNGSLANKLRCAFLILFVFFIDRVLKILIFKYFAVGESFAFWPNVLHITRVSNTGAAFGIFKGYGSFLIVISASLKLFSPLSCVIVATSFPMNFGNIQSHNLYHFG